MPPISSPRAPGSLAPSRSSGPPPSPCPRGPRPATRTPASTPATLAGPLTHRAASSTSTAWASVCRTASASCTAGASARCSGASPRSSTAAPRPSTATRVRGGRESAGLGGFRFQNYVVSSSRSDCVCIPTPIANQTHTHTGKAHPRWRPIQSLIALTDNDRPDLGGFECVRGFHREFEAWATTRAPCAKTGRPPPCVGDFTPIRPVEDAEVIRRFAPVPYRAGDVVAFDFRIPHANAAVHKGTAPRQCSYGSFLPDVPINRAYANRQRELYLDGRRQPDDQWKESEGDEPREEEPMFAFSKLGWALLGSKGSSV